MESVDLYCLKKSHRTWATVAGVPGIACDRQLGHASATVGEATEFARLLAGSETGRTYYVDMESSLVDASLSAKAVRKLLDEAFAALETGGVTMLLASRNALEPAKLRGPKFGPSGVPEGVVIVGPFSGSKARQALR